MKVSELFEAYTPPVKNKKLGFSTTHKIPVGGTKEWMKSFSATAEHIEQAMRQMKQSQIVKKLQSLGLFDESTDRHRKIGSMMFIGTMAEGSATFKPRVRRLKITVQPNGKIDETAPNDHHRAPIASGKPHIVPGDPVGSIVKTMTGAMEKLVSAMEKRRDKEKKLVAAYQKASAK